MNIIGKTEEDAKKELRNCGKKLRVVKRDYENFMCTMDWVPDRINVEVEEGRIVQVISAG